VDETPQPGEHPGTYVTRLAADKARAAGSLAGYIGPRVLSRLRRLIHLAWFYSEGPPG